MRMRSEFGEVRRSIVLTDGRRIFEVIMLVMVVVMSVVLWTTTDAMA